ncbi:hypothetical protein M077_1549 [Bacteroides fragilis str. 2-F-2 |nr:hypothetical protein M077_1549 [Bacteroides fragilis str. 2-F-2 \
MRKQSKFYIIQNNFQKALLINHVIIIVENEKTFHFNKKSFFNWHLLQYIMKMY